MKMRRAGLLELLTVVVWVAVGFTLCLWLSNTCGCGEVVDDDWEESDTDADGDRVADAVDDAGDAPLDAPDDSGGPEGDEAEADGSEANPDDGGESEANPDEGGESEANSEADSEANDSEADESDANTDDSETNYTVTWCHDGYASSGTAASRTIHMRPGYTYRIDVCERHEAGNPWIWIDDRRPCDRSEPVDCPDGYAGALTCEVDEIKDITYYVRTDVGLFRICVTESGGPGVGE